MIPQPKETYLNCLPFYEISSTITNRMNTNNLQNKLNQMNQMGCCEELIKISEDTLHQQCIQWFRYQHNNTGAIIHHSPNENPQGTRSTLIRYNSKMKKLGRLAGFPDLMILHKGNILFIELKSKTGKLSNAQKQLFPEIQDAGFYVHIVRTLENFQKLVNQFIAQSI